MRASTLVALTLSYALVDGRGVPHKRSNVEPYAPFSTPCPYGSLIRSAHSVSSEEEAYIQGRSRKASQALSDWLSQAWKGSDTELSNLPTLALALSGGGPKAGLAGAGVVYGLDSREKNDSPVGGLLQSMTYVSALSGGSLTLSGIMANDFAKISTLRNKFYDKNFENPFAVGLANRDTILADVGNKSVAGYPASLVDTYGRVISYTYIAGGQSGGNGLLWSNITTQPSFQDYEAPYPIITITQANVAADMCMPKDTSAVWEVSAFEYGSWDENVAAFYPTQYMGTVGDGVTGKCTVGFDNIGFITGISSNILVNSTYCMTGNYSSSSLNMLSSLVDTAFPGPELVVPYGIIPNPFYRSSDAGVIRNQPNLYGTDGGYSGQGIPIFPWLQPERNVDVIFIVDTESDEPYNITNGDSVYATYTSANMKGLSKMPVVPTVAQFAAQNLSSRPQFYGCHDSNVATLIFLPDTELGNVTSDQFFYQPEQIKSTFQGGVDMVTQPQNEQWAACLACGIMHKASRALPDICTSCLETYCWNPPSGKSDSVCVGSDANDPNGILQEVPCA